MTSHYPTFRDVLRRVTSSDEVHAQLLMELFSAIVAMMTELGVKPSGSFGSIFGRMFGNELVSKRCGYWRKISLQIISPKAGFLAGSPDFTTTVRWQVDRFKGASTVNGEDIPFIFPIYQGRQGVSYITQRNNGGNAGGTDKTPWNIYAYNVVKQSATLAGGCLNGTAPTGGNNQIDIGVVAWGLPSKAPEG